jgi:hypothetical protein
VTLTLTQARQALGYDLAGANFIVGTVAAAPAPTTTAIKIAALLDNGIDDTAYVDQYLWLPSAAADDQERRIITYTATTGLIVPHRPWSGAPTAAWVTEVHRWPPSMLNRALNDALARCFYADWISVTPVANTRVYDLSTTNTWITHPRQIIGAYWRNTDTSNTGALQLIISSKAEQDGGTIQLRIDPPPRSTTGFDIYVLTKHPYDPFTTEASSTTCPPLWLRAGAKMTLFQRLREMASSNKERDRYVLEEREAEREFRNQSQLNQVHIPAKVQGATPYYPWGASDARVQW